MKKNLLRRHIVWLIAAAWVYTFTFIFNNYWSKYASYETVTRSFQKHLKERETVFTDWVQDTSFIKDISRGVRSDERLQEAKQLPFYIFIYNDSSEYDIPLFWSTNAVLPDPYHVSFYPTGSFAKLGNGEYELLKRKVRIAEGSFTVAALLQLHEQFFIENGMLQKEYPGFAGLGDKFSITLGHTAYPIVGENGKAIAYLQPKAPEPIYIFNWLSFFTQCVSTILLLVFISRFSHDLISRHFLLGLGFFVTCFLFLRFSVQMFGVPVDFRQFPLFADEVKFSAVGTTQLREFVWHALFGIWAAAFITSQTSSILNFLSGFGKPGKWVATIGIAIGAVAGHFILINMVRSLYLNSSVAFDLTNFFSFNFTTVISFLIIFLLAVSHYMFLRFAVLAFQRFGVASNAVILFLIAALGLTALSILSNQSAVKPLIYALAWLLLFFFASFARLVKPAIRSSGTMVAWLFIYSVSLSLFMGILSESRLRTRTVKLAKSLLLQHDQTSERLVKIAAHNVDRIDWYKLLKQSTTQDLAHEKKDSLVEEYFGGYLDRFSTGIYFFDRNRLGMFHNGDVNFESLNTLYETQGSKIGGDRNLAYFNESFDKFGYIIKKEVQDTATKRLAGYVFVMIRSLRSANQVFSPELFRQLQNFAVNLPQDISYAWYKNGILVEQYRNYPFQTNLPVQVSNSLSRWENETSDTYELWMKGGADTTLVIAAQRNVFIGYISMMAYLFGAFLMFYGIYAVLFAMFRGKFASHVLERASFNLQTKIRLTVVTILTVSFIIVAVVTISFFINQFKADNTEKLAQSVQAVSAELAQEIPAEYDTLPQPDKRKFLQETINRITKNQNIDVNCFDSTGMILATTQNVLYEKGVLSPMADPLVWWNLTRGEVHRYISTESIGSLQYSSIYQPMLSRKNDILFYLQVPFFASQSELNREISNFLVILINIIAFVFLLSGSLAYWISGSLTKSFNVIAEKMNRIRLSEHNERIEWTPKDEIGNLVFQYNKMVDQLEDSVKKMARTEREMAWREMAKQVAHEIKNPLTPMKLSLQFLQKAIREKNGDVAQITERVASNLVGQIDHLSKIATDFSQFANLGNYKPELFNVQNSLREVIQIYEMHEHLSITWNGLSEPLNIVADKTQINRLITNLLQNASESSDASRRLVIEIGERLVPGSVVISVSDNGNGIPESVKNNIFMPNFTTKSSGTGLGLSICKAIVENAGGAIWFETETGVGTTFYVRLPLAK